MQYFPYTSTNDTIFLISNKNKENLGYHGTKTQNNKTFKFPHTQYKFVYEFYASQFTLNVKFVYEFIYACFSPFKTRLINLIFLWEQIVKKPIGNLSWENLIFPSEL